MTLSALPIKAELILLHSIFSISPIRLRKYTASQQFPTKLDSLHHVSSAFIVSNTTLHRVSDISLTIENSPSRFEFSHRKSHTSRDTSITDAVQITLNILKRNHGSNQDYQKSSRNRKRCCEFLRQQHRHHRQHPDYLRSLDPRRQGQ